MLCLRPCLCLRKGKPCPDVILRQDWAWHPGVLLQRYTPACTEQTEILSEAATVLHTYTQACTRAHLSSYSCSCIQLDGSSLAPCRPWGINAEVVQQSWVAVWKLINKNEGWPQGPRVRRVWGPSRNTPAQRGMIQTLAAQRPLTHLEINYACFHITIQAPPPLGNLDSFNPVYTRLPPPNTHPPTHCRPWQGNRQVTVTQSCLLQLLPGCRLQYLWYWYYASESENSYSCHQLSFYTTSFFPPL